MNIFLQPAGESSRKQLDLTISTKKNLEKIKDFITKEQYDKLNNLYPDKQLNMWGVTPNKENVWKQMQIGDLVLFYGNKKFFTLGIIRYKLHNRNLAKDIWGADDKGLHWEYIYCLSNVLNINIPLESFNHLTGYKFKQVQGAMKVAKENATKKILKEYANTFYFNDEDVQKKEEESKLQELKNGIWNLNIQNTTHNLKIVTSKKNMENKTKSSKKSSKTKQQKKKNLSDSLSDSDRYHLGVLGELYINKLLEEKNSTLLEQLNLLHKNIDIICYNKDYQNQKDWEDKSVHKGHDILIKLKDSKEEIYLEVKTSLEDTNFYSMSGNEFKFSKEKGDNYYIIKISNFIAISDESDIHTLQLCMIRNPYKLLKNGDMIKDISLYC